MDPDMTDVLKVEKKDSDTKRRFWHAKKPTNFQLIDTSYTTTGNNVCDKKNHLQLFSQQKQWQNYQ